MSAQESVILCEEFHDQRPKEHAWSHMAGWYADAGCDEFYQAVWRDGHVVTELEARLRANGSWDAMTAIAR